MLGSPSKHKFGDELIYEDLVLSEHNISDVIHKNT